MTNSYAIIRAIAKIEGMTCAEKFAGAMLALHLDRKKNQITVKQATLAKECGMAERSIRRAIAKIVKAGVLVSVRKSHGLVLIPQGPTGESSVLLESDRTGGAGDSGRAWPVRGKRKPWEYDLTLSTLAEEEYKRLCEQKGFETAANDG